MVCLGCLRPSSSHLCGWCGGRLRATPERVLAGGIRLITAHEHTGLAATLVHDLKYRGAAGYAELIASTLAPRLPSAPIVAIPRSWSRYALYGVDPAEEIAIRIARLNRVPYVKAFARRWHTARRAGHNRNRPIPTPALRLLPETPVVIVDDVVTTGATFIGAIRSIGRERVLLAVAANDAASPSTLARDASSRWVGKP
jgi:predicted amidophosphoribosyltransferase